MPRLNYRRRPTRRPFPTLKCGSVSTARCRFCARKPVRLAKIETTSVRKSGTGNLPASLDDLDRLQPDEIFRRLYRDRFGEEAPQEQLSAFAELLFGPAEKAA